MSLIIIMVEHSCLQKLLHSLSHLILIRTLWNRHFHSLKKIRKWKAPINSLSKIITDIYITHGIITILILQMRKPRFKKSKIICSNSNVLSPNVYPLLSLFSIYPLPPPFFLCGVVVVMFVFLLFSIFPQGKKWLIVWEQPNVAVLSMRPLCYLARVLPNGM